MAGFLRARPAVLAGALGRAGLLSPRLAGGTRERVVLLLLCSLYGGCWRPLDDAAFLRLAAELCARHFGLAAAAATDSEQQQQQRAAADESAAFAALEAAFAPPPASDPAPAPTPPPPPPPPPPAASLLNDSLVPRLLACYLRTSAGGAAWLQLALGRVLEQQLQADGLHAPADADAGSGGLPAHALTRAHTHTHTHTHTHLTPLSF